MAHQAHTIPWQTLTDNLVYLHCSPRNHGITNLYLRKTKDPHQVKQIRYFVRGFARALSAYATIERTKYTPDPTPPELDEILISDAAVKKMAKTVLQYKSDDESVTVPFSLDDILTARERSAKSFVYSTMPGEGDMFSEMRETCEQTKALLMHGEMDTLFRLAAHPRVYFRRMWSEDEWANAHGFGLSKLLDAALQAYICLNVLTLRAELYDDASREMYIARETTAGRNTHEKEEYDYRFTAAYQRMLLNCTGLPYGWQCDAHTFPHRQFFGVRRGQYRFSYDDTQYGRWQKGNLGTQRVKELAHSTYQGVHVPSKVDVVAVLNMLGTKGLPVELALQILDTAEYIPVSRLLISSDPLHADNAEELKKYTSYCWKLLVRVDMMCREGVNGPVFDWEAEVSHTLYTLFDMPGRSLFTGQRHIFGTRQRKLLET
ncbi:hypothetical protein P171DRAFT_427836 [Karstenula rhodostoma CBS 690.94]|uniref:Uncharacterized protein n=1 Tax=Karstenula rhodostoma CBS 690.94 TaxID=1392251 RepID=A0A9P4UGJ9_9PLEO|nr:hypothetical protein P171DRAFT_427836 [Karstenula rhodostoma CBS 690.94]